MAVNTKLKMTIVVCIALVFLISATVHLNILINNDTTDVFAAFIGRILFVIIDFSMGVWLECWRRGATNKGFARHPLEFLGWEEGCGHHTGVRAGV